MTTIICVPSCWTPVPCPTCGKDLPPRGRAVPIEHFLAECCDEARMCAVENPRHLWDEEEAAAFADLLAAVKGES